MKILVCVKQVADPETNFSINPASTWIDEETRITYRMNRFDEYALEEALQIKDKYPEVMIDVLTVGSERSVSTLKKAFEKGADSGFHIITDNVVLNASETAELIAEFARCRDYDMIFTGVMSEDLMQCQVGPIISSLLSIPCAVSVVKAEIIKNRTAVSVYSELEGGLAENIEIAIPCLLTIQTGINIPRYPSLSNVIRARSMEIIKINSTDLLRSKHNEKKIIVTYPQISSRGLIIDGSIEEKAERILMLLHERSLI